VHITFPSGLTAGNTIVVGIALTPPGIVNGLTSISDSKGFSYTQAVNVCVGALCAYIYYATASSGGADTVTVSVVNHIDAGEQGGVDAYIYEVSGITTSGMTMATGQGSGSGSQSVFTSSSASFSSGAFLLGVISNTYNEITFSAGGGFIPSTQKSGSGDGWAEYSDPASSPTNFPATIGTGVTRSWVEAGVVFPPSSNPPIPEYPLGLPLLAIFMILAFSVIRRRTVTKQK